MSISCKSTTTPISISHQMRQCCCSGKRSIGNPCGHPVGGFNLFPLPLPPVHVVLRACRGHGQARPRRHGRRRGGQLVEPQPERLLHEDAAAHALGPTLIQPLVTDLLSVKGFFLKKTTTFGFIAMKRKASLYDNFCSYCLFSYRFKSDSWLEYCDNIVCKDG